MFLTLSKNTTLCTYYDGFYNGNKPKYLWNAILKHFIITNFI